jgi:hypothetical protein
MKKIKRKVSKTRPKTHKNCAPCLAALNPGRRRNSFKTVYILTTYPSTGSSSLRIEEYDDFDAQERLEELLSRGYQALLFENLSDIKKAIKIIEG